MKFVNIGFGNTVCAERIISVVSPESAPIKRLVIDGKANGTAASVRAVAKVLGISELENWRPDRLPEPLEEKVIPFSSLRETLLHTYDPRHDSELLKTNRSAFEELRGSYPVRREFQAFTVCGAPEKERKILEKLGFGIR